MMRSEHYRQSGFTLVEVQIALLILVMIMAVLMGSLHLVSKTMNTVTALEETHQDQRIVSRFLRQQFSNILPLRALEDGELSVIYQGDEQGVYFVGRLPEQVVAAGPWLLHLNIKDKQLLLDYRAIDLAISVKDNMTADYESVVLLSDVDEMTLRYYDGQRWQSRWRDSEQLPMAVEVNIEQGERDWPVIVGDLPMQIALQSRFNVMVFQ